MERTLGSYDKLDISKKSLLLLSGLAWFVAGCMLINRCTAYLLEFSHHILFNFLVGFALGILLFALLFFRISKRYIQRILDLEPERPFIISLSNLRVYFLIALLIGAGYYLRRTDQLNNINISIAYISFGFTLIFSSFKFFYSFAAFKKPANQKNASC
jgi:hypothetical protein